MTSEKGLNLPVEDQVDPIRAEKYCVLHINQSGKIVLNSGVLKKQTIIEGIASCNEGRPHESPDPSCHCGFYAFKYTRGAEAEFDGNLAMVLVEVDLYGKIIVATKGYRAQYQRILVMRYLPFCYQCGERPVGLAPEWNEDPSEAPLYPVCQNHLTRDSISLSQASNQLGTKIWWDAVDECVA